MRDASHLHLVRSGALGCGHCRLRRLCIPGHAQEHLSSPLGKLIKARPPIARGTYLFRQGAPMTSYFFMRSGSAKSVVNDDEGRESIMSFLLPTEVIGTASMDQTVYHDSVVALERSSFCEVATRDLIELFRADKDAQGRFLSMVADRIGLERHARVRLERSSADERLADFLAELSDRFARLGRDPYTFQLTMSRYDIANYIGLAAETVSRVLRRLSDQGIIAVQHKNVRILDVTRLRRAATHRDADAR